MSKHDKRKQKSKEMKKYAKKASKTFSKDTAQLKRECSEKVEKPYISGFEIEA